MSAYKLIAIDIDGTLLNSKKELLEITKNDIHRAYEKGVIISIATGRAFPAAKRYIEQIGLNIPLILFNGCLIRMSDENKILYSMTIDSNVAKNVYDIVSQKSSELFFICI